MKKLRILFLIVFIFSITMIGLGIRDKVKSQIVNDELSKIYYKEYKDKNIDKKSINKKKIYKKSLDKKDGVYIKNDNNNIDNNIDNDKIGKDKTAKDKIEKDKTGKDNIEKDKIDNNNNTNAIVNNPSQGDSISDEEIRSGEYLVKVKPKNIVANSKKYVILDEFKALIEKNENTVGWIKIQNTNIDYPVVQGDDNDFYLNHDFYNRRNSQGSIFMDFRSRANLEDKHTIIYGHHMKNRTMFNDLNFYKDEEFFKANRTFTMKSLYKEETYEIFSTHIYENDPYIIKTRFNNDEFISFIDLIKEKAEHEIDIDIEKDDKILTLITCAYDFKDARYVVHARKVK
nr:class B sortase [Tissierella sp.]